MFSYAFSVLTVASEWMRLGDMMKHKQIEPSIMLVIILAFLASLAFAGTKQATPVLTAEQKETIRKFQLDDARISGRLKDLQLEMIQLQQQSQQNAKSFRDYVAGLCKEPAGYTFDFNSDDLRCIAKPATHNVENKK